MSDGAIKYVGVDGCKAGWIGVGLDDGKGWEVKASIKFSELIEHFKDACVILVDVPIGLVENAKDVKRGGRDCDRKARKKLGVKRQSSVFSAPSREFVKAVMENPCWDYQDAKVWLDEQLEGKTGVRINNQTFSITRTIGEVDKALPLVDESVSSKIREAHPEVCFWALNGGKLDSSISPGKKTSSGLRKRIETLRHCAQYVDGIDVDAICKEARRKYTKTQVADDDILDALALAVTAKIGWRNGFRRLPKDLSTDRKEPPEMVYAMPNNIESASRSEK